ncbi:gas vesicle protein [Streptomyces sp. Ru73]|uniref:gas vesicle protein GvpG n=1 Tax=Streptomyces sp. Ru73 TaxID=2080748 RepID=UPI000CDDD6A5|nr:gas vesicle protein GvpG [Streptomyces sp. Ru73]POX39334.1 gas vesicle protein [Streptomyces sp. Ru73]
MGLLKEVLLLPVAPVRGTGWVLRQVVAEAERQYYDPQAIQKELRELEHELDDGRIDEAEFDRREDELLDRLAVARGQAPHGPAVPGQAPHGQRE